MPIPSRIEISADVTLPSFLVEVLQGGFWNPITNLVLSANASLDAGGGPVSGVSMGPSVSPTASLTLDRGARGFESDRLPVRIAFGFAASSLVLRFAGLLMAAQGSALSATRDWELRGYDALIEGCEVRSYALRRRPIFTLTSLTSIEDPASGVYKGGLGNFILWSCGGRPDAQAASYPTAAFYYAATEALIGPEWTWIAGDNPWEVLRRLCRAAGGQLYQDGAGLVRYVDPITLASGAAVFTYTDEVLSQEQRAAQAKSGYADVAETRASDRAMTGATCAYVSRLVQGEQIVYEESIPRQLAGGAAITLTCDTQLPLYRMRGVEMDGATVRGAIATTPTTAPVTFVHESAQRVKVTITNTQADPIIIYALRLFGRPISAGEEGSARYIAGTGRIVTVEDSPYVQGERHAAMLVRMIFDGEAQAALAYRLLSVPYDMDRLVGQIVALTCADLSLSALRCRLVKIDANGGWMDLDLAPLGGLPTLDTVHIVGSIGGTRDMAY